MFTSGRWFGRSATPSSTASTPASVPEQARPGNQQPDHGRDPSNQNMQTISIRPESHAYPLHQPPAHSSGHSRPQESLSASPSPSASPSTHCASHAHQSLAQLFDNANHDDHSRNDHTHSHYPSARQNHHLPDHGDSTSDSLSASESESQSQSQSDVHGTDSDDGDGDDDDDDQDTPDEEDLLWKDWFLSLPGNEFLVNVPDTFIEDEFNLTGLAAMVPFFHESLDLILDRDAEDNVDPDLVESSAQLLYTLIHARWIITKAGLQAMLEKIENRVFGVCPRVLCFGYPLLPVGPFDLPGMGAVKLYCHSCQDTYHPQSNRFARLDGASIGSTFPHLMFLSFPDLHDHILELTRDPASPGKDSVFYVPKMFGFRVHEKADTPDVPRAYWLRALPGSDRRSGKLVEL